MTPQEAAQTSADMGARRSTELAGDEAHYRLKKACMARAVELYELLTKAREEFLCLPSSLGYDITDLPAIDQLLKEIEHAAQ